MMGANYAFYYALGFTMGALTKHCARDYKLRYNEILKMNDLREVFQDIKFSNYEGNNVAMFCFYNEITPCSESNIYELVAEGNSLRAKLIARGFIQKYFSWFFR